MLIFKWPLIVRDRKIGCSQKRDLGACKGTSLLGSGVELPLIFYTKKRKRKKKYKLHDQNISNVID